MSNEGERYALSAWEHTWLKAFAEAIKESFAARADLDAAKVKVAECEAALMVARARLLAAESRHELAHKLGDLAEQQAIKVSDRAERAIAEREEERRA